MITLRRMAFYHPGKGDAASRAVLFIKDNRNPRVCRFLANQLSFGLREECFTLGIDPQELVITYAPRGRRAVIRMGFDQAAMLAEALAKELGAQCLPLLVRRRGGKEQKHLSASERQRNVKTRFDIDRKSMALCGKRTVVLVDDIVTTGASMAACVTLLRRAGVSGVIGLCVCSVP